MAPYNIWFEIQFTQNKLPQYNKKLKRFKYKNCQIRYIIHLYSHAFMIDILQEILLQSQGKIEHKQHISAHCAQE